MFPVPDTIYSLLKRRQLAQQEEPPNLTALPQLNIPPQQAPMPVATAGAFQPAQINMPAPGPAETVYNNLLNRAPQQADYQPTRMQRVLAAIAGGLAGASGGAKVGMQTAQSFDPYLQARQRWQEQLEAINPQVQLEQQRFERGLKAAQLGTQQGKILSDEAITQSQMNQTAAENERKAREKDREDTEKERHDKMLEKFQQMTAQKKSPIEIEMEMYKTDPEQYKRFNEMRHPRETLEEAMKKFEAHEKLRLKYEPTIAAARTAAEQNTMPAGQLQPLIDSAHKVMENNPESYTDYLKMIPEKLRTRVMAEVPVENYVVGEGKGKVANARATLGHITNMRAMVNDPFIKKNLGPLLGRVQSAEGKIGGDIIARSPADREKEQEFLNYLNLAMTWEASVSSSNRPSWQLIQQLKSQGPKPSLDPDRFEGALKAMENSASTAMEGMMPGSKKKQKTPTGQIDYSKMRVEKE